MVSLTEPSDSIGGFDRPAAESHRNSDTKIDGLRVSGWLGQRIPRRVVTSSIGLLVNFIGLADLRKKKQKKRARGGKRIWRFGFNLLRGGQEKAEDMICE